MEPYKLKHKPTGLYYKPYVTNGSQLSKTGKIYQTRLNALTGENRFIHVRCKSGSLIHKRTKDIINWKSSIYGGTTLRADTKKEDWEKEEI